MKKSIIKTGIFALLSLTFIVSACEKNLDVNTDPNNPSLDKGAPNLVFPAAVASTAGRIGGDYAILGGMWAQYWTQSTVANQYRNIDSYNVTQTNFNASFDETFAGALNDYQYVINKSEESQDWNFLLMGTVMKAYTYQVLLDLYGMLPYDEAFQGIANLQPKYEEGYDVYVKLLAEIDTALAKDFTAKSNTLPGASDLVFDGDMGKWMEFANTLKLKMYLRMAYVKPAEAEAGIKAMYAAGATFLQSDASLDKFIDQADQSNPLYEYNYRKLNVATNLRASNTLLTYLQSNADPRAAAYFTKPGGAFTGLNQGDYANEAVDAGLISVAIVKATDPVDFISLAESNFLQAEALERYFSGNGAKDKYDAGVTAAFARYGFATEAAGFIASGAAYEYPTAASFEEKLEAIITQKWASLPGSHSLEAFFERNRTGYPKTSAVYSNDPAYVPGQFVVPSESVLGNEFPKRLIFPESERKANPNTPDIKPLTENIWWDAN